AASCHAGSSGGLGGEMTTPEGVGTDPSGNVYVADSDNNRVQKFDSSGNFLAAWGKGVNGGSAFGICTVAASCRAGSGGSLGGDMSFPESAATDGAGDLYITDPGNGRIQKFSDPVTSGPTGQRAAALKKCKKKHSKRARRKCRRKANLLPV